MSRRFILKFVISIRSVLLPRGLVAFYTDLNLPFQSCRLLQKIYISRHRRSNVRVYNSTIVGSTSFIPTLKPMCVTVYSASLSYFKYCTVKPIILIFKHFIILYCSFLTLRMLFLFLAIQFYKITGYKFRPLEHCLVVFPGRWGHYLFVWQERF